jgi:hypothetical protein
MASGRRHWRKMTWTLIVWNVLLIASIITAFVAARNTPNCESDSGRELCKEAISSGGVIVGGLLIFLWIAGDIIFGLLWLVTIRRRRTIE